MSLKRILVGGGFAVLVLTTGRSIPAAPLAPETYSIQDHGQPCVFEVATNELNVVTRDFTRRRQAITGAASSEAVRARGEALRNATGDDVNLVLYEAGMPHSDLTRRVLTKEVLVQLDPTQDPAALAKTAGAIGQRAVPFAPGHFLFQTAETGGALGLAARLAAQPGVISAEPQLARRQQKRFLPNDTFFTNQWHLKNTGQRGGSNNIDINVTNVWDTYKGDGVRVAIVDDGLQYTHPDLSPNYDASTSTNFNENNADPSPNIANEDFHGTSCGGVSAGRGNNALGICGSAFQASLVGIRLIGADTTDDQEAAAMTYKSDLIHIKSNSWGPADDGSQFYFSPGPLTLAALSNATLTGRSGKGTIFTWAAGNGLEASDNANYDGYANSIYVIPISAVSDQGFQPYYSEPGACTIVAAPSNEDTRQGITTVDLVGNDGYNATGVSGELTDRSYTQTFGGTSSATPLAAGVIALILQANPNLGWRDVEDILIRTATKNAATDSDWKTNSAGLRFNHKYGAGLINARAAVTAALTWTNLGPMTNVTSSQSGLSVSIPDNNTNGITRTFDLSASNLRVEKVTVTANILHTFRGDLAITLVSPTGMASRLTETHYDEGTNIVNWTYSSVHDWGESSTGSWKVIVADAAAQDVGTLTAIKLTVYGTAIATNNAGPFSIASINKSLTNAIINFQSVIGKTYVVQARTNLVSGTWTNLVSNLPAAGVNTLVTDSVVNAAEKYYRVQMLP